MISEVKKRLSLVVAFFKSLTQNSRDFNREMNAQSELFSDVGYKPASEIKVSGGSQPRN